MKFSEIPYQRPDLDMMKSEFESALKNLKDAQKLSKAVEAVKIINNLRNNFHSALSLAFIRYCINTKDDFYAKEKDFYDEALPQVEALLFSFYETLLESRFKKELEKIYKSQLFNIARMTLRTFKPTILEDLERENKLSTSYAGLVSSAQVEFDGRRITLSQLRAYELSPDRDTRKRACEARYEFFAKNESRLDEIYDQLVKVRHEIARKLGFESFVPLAYLRLKRSDYTVEDVAKLRRSVKTKIVPLLQKLREKQREILKIDKLKYYDMPILLGEGDPRPVGTRSELVEAAKVMYEQMSDATGEFFNFMLANELMDLDSREGKYPGGFCDFIADHKSPFIFANFNGTSHDVEVLTHEAGHAFQVYRSRNFEVPEYYWPTAEACEIHSMGMEFLAWPWMELFYRDRAEQAKLVHAWKALNFVAYGVSIDEFQHMAYQNPDLTPQERRKLWRQIESKYMPEIDYDGIRYLEDGGLWQQQMHVYESSFYYIDYVIAQFCAFQLLKRSFEDRASTLQDYIKLCDLGGSLSFQQLLKVANIQSPFDESVAESLGDLLPLLK
ncbi:MAG: M3 family oligoendopeptidase [Pseudothermotoga sp.]|uniref:M3 family oligoendopeptidase n=1 Tax=Pseudothermotoga sp. TaxID=2033661 RepID=UPI0019BA392B|nr:M3 family oligoendopeptidase [Pseudothermotoga sp.]